jgi:hypothetical protein
MSETQAIDWESRYRDGTTGWDRHGLILSDWPNGPPFHCDSDVMRRLSAAPDGRWPEDLPIRVPRPSGLVAQPPSCIGDDSRTATSQPPQVWAALSGESCPTCGPGFRGSHWCETRAGLVWPAVSSPPDHGYNSRLQLFVSVPGSPP